MATTLITSALKWLGVLVVGAAGAACAYSPPAAPAGSGSAVLWLPDGATTAAADVARGVVGDDGRRIYPDGSGDLSFTTSSDCNTLAHGIRRRFETTGWRPQTTDYLSGRDVIPQVTCHAWAGGGVVSTDASGRAIPNQPQLTWNGQWANTTGDVVSYSIRQFSGRLLGHAQFIPASVATRAARRR